MSMTTATVQVTNLTVYQGTYAAVRDVSFELFPGTNTAIVGPNGAGKSTLVQAVLGLIPYTGQVQILGRPLSRLGRLRDRIGYIPQNFIFDRSFPISVMELVGLGWVPPEPLGQSATTWRWPWQQNPAKQAAIAQALQRVSAYHLRQQAIGTLSGGELKRVLLAYCLVTARQLLVLDEAFAGVDAQGELDFYKLLCQLQREQNWTVLQVSHDLEMVSRHCDRVLCLNQTIICDGQPESTLSPDNLLQVYGPSLARYHHHH